MSVQFTLILTTENIEENCNFDYYFNKTDVKPSVLDGGHEIVLANWSSFKHLVCTDHNLILIDIHSHPYVLLNRSTLCSCIMETENNFS